VSPTREQQKKNRKKTLCITARDSEDVDRVARRAWRKWKREGTDKSLSFPGSLGGMNWGSIAFDPSHQYMFVNDMRLGLWIQLIEQTPEDLAVQANGGEKVNTGMGAVPMKGTPYKVNKDRKFFFVFFYSVCDWLEEVRKFA
jgi:glucose dehydrogenase